MPGKRATFTPPGHLCFLMHYPTIHTHKGTHMYDQRCNAGGARWSRLYTTKINIKQSPDPGIEPETSDMPGKRAAFTPPGHLCFLMHYPTISTHR